MPYRCAAGGCRRSKRHQCYRRDTAACGRDVHLKRSVRDGQHHAYRSPPFSPVAVRTAALTLIMCRPPITPTVLRYSYPFTMTSTGGRLPAASCSMTSPGTTIPVLLPVAATVASNVTLLGLDAVSSSSFTCRNSPLSAQQGQGPARRLCYIDAPQGPGSSPPGTDPPGRRTGVLPRQSENAANAPLPPAGRVDCGEINGLCLASGR